LHVNFVQSIALGDGQCPPLDDEEYHCGERCCVTTKYINIGIVDYLYIECSEWLKVEENCR
jgi:hypothetical protein